MKLEITIDKQESKRLHMDWWGKCRTCRFWHGADDIRHVRWLPSKCENPSSDLHGQETWTEGECNKWDSFDIETALEMMREIEVNLADDKKRN